MKYYDSVSCLIPIHSFWVGMGISLSLYADSCAVNVGPDQLYGFEFV